LHRIEIQDAINRRCSECGGPIAKQGGACVRCEWCHQEYEVNDGELQVRPDRERLKPALREFADALHEKR
jgi:nitrite reductase/ring-hydroxylating ferredoxin subunit